MTSHLDFLRRLLADPADDLTRLVYADWLDDRADPDSRTRSAFLQAEVEWAGLPPADPRRGVLEGQLRSAALALPTRWKAATSMADVWLVGRTGTDCCPDTWNLLAPTPERKLRACRGCGRAVAYCTTVGQGLWNVARGVAVAFDRQVLMSSADPEFAQFSRVVDVSRRPPRTEADPLAPRFGPTEYRTRRRTL